MDKAGTDHHDDQPGGGEPSQEGRDVDGVQQGQPERSRDRERADRPDQWQWDIVRKRR